MSSYADEGTVAHALASMCLTEGKDAAAYLGRVIECEDYEHASLSPSNAIRWMQCPGSYALERREKFVPRKFSLEVTEEMAEGVQVYVNAIREYAGLNLHPNYGFERTLLVEQRVPIGQITGEEGEEGTSDAIIITADGEELQAHDLKFGMGVRVSAEKNKQLMLYALGALEFVTLMGYSPKRIRLVIHQPRLDAPSEWDCSVEELLVFAEEATRAANHARATLEEKPEALIHHLKPGDEQCRFCPAKATCPALAKFVQDEIGADFETLGAVADPARTDIKQKIIPVYSDADLGKKMAATDLIEDWCRAVRAKVESELFAGNEVPGYKLVQGKKGNRAWSAEEEAEAAMKAMRLKQEEMYTFKVISPTVAEKKFKSQPKRWKKLEALITQSPGKPSVAPVSDKREALVIGKVEDDFEALDGAH